MNEINKTYLCDPEKNTECSKEICYLKDGPCCHTTNELYKAEYPITNQDVIAEMVRTMDPEKLAKDISSFVENGSCMTLCPCGEDYCDKIYHKKINGKEMTCERVLLRWLKERRTK